MKMNIKTIGVICGMAMLSQAMIFDSYAVEVDMTGVAVAESLIKSGGPSESGESVILKDANGNENIYFSPSANRNSSLRYADRSNIQDGTNATIDTAGETAAQTEAANDTAAENAQAEASAAESAQPAAETVPVNPFEGAGKAYKYFALGNSITVHPLAEFWYVESGMAASTPEKDFFHLVTEGLKQRHGQVVSFAYNYHAWEKAASDRNDLNYRIDPFLDPELDLITVELGENVTDTTTLSKDYAGLINYIKAKCPKAHIIIIDDFWHDAEHSAIKATTASLYNVDFMSLARIKENPNMYTCGLGTKVYDASGKEHTVKSQSVAGHPGDLAMQYYATKILSILDRTDE